MDTKKYLSTVFAVFVALFTFDFLANNFLLKDAYIETISLWRLRSEQNMFLILLTELLYSAVFVYIFTRNYEDKGTSEGVRFGFYIGLLMATTQFGKYAFMPIPFSLAFSWMVSGIISSVISGVIASVVYGSSKKIKL
jgi:hypothetical protein